MGLSLVASGKSTAKAVMPSLLKEACELIAFSYPGVNAWAREKSFSAPRLERGVRLDWFFSSHGRATPNRIQRMGPRREGREHGEGPPTRWRTGDCADADLAGGAGAGCRLRIGMGDSDAC